jgi:hypothetical protein
MSIATNGTYSKGSVRHYGCAIRFFLIVRESASVKCGATPRPTIGASCRSVVPMVAT